MKIFNIFSIVNVLVLLMVATNFASSTSIYGTIYEPVDLCRGWVCVLKDFFKVRGDRTPPSRFKFGLSPRD